MLNRAPTTAKPAPLLFDCCRCRSTGTCMACLRWLRQYRVVTNRQIAGRHS